jgi:uncharacterized membrane protein
LAAEWGWSQFAMPNPWPGALLGEALALVPPTAVAAGMVGGFVGSALAMPIRPQRVGLPRPVPAAVALLAILAVVGYGVQVAGERRVRAQLESSQPRGPGREVTVTVRLEPRDAGQDANWLQAIAWQGRAKLVLEPLERVGDGVYRTPEPAAHGRRWCACTGTTCS